jgi:hypothetical protein
MNFGSCSVNGKRSKSELGLKARQLLKEQAHILVLLWSCSDVESAVRCNATRFEKSEGIEADSITS